MHLTRPHSEIQTPLQSVIGNAALGCMVCLLLATTARPMLERLQVGWAELLAFAIGPVLTALTILYGCGARQELSGLKRLTYLFLTSCAIFLVVSLTVAGIICAACIFIGFSRIGP